MDQSTEEFNLLLPLMGALVIAPVIGAVWLLLRHFDRKAATSLSLAVRPGGSVASAFLRTVLGLVLFFIILGTAIFVIEAVKSMILG